MWIMRIGFVLALTVSLVGAVGGVVPSVASGGDVVSGLSFDHPLTRMQREPFPSSPVMRAAPIGNRDDGGDPGRTWLPRNMLCEPAPRGVDLVTRETMHHQHQRDHARDAAG
ncbi:MAG TPA: hypothetical protein VEL07_07465 [Planctomycetota bacterium]|nr:hypothetical protein [Planctomycetota bacterium]